MRAHSLSLHASARRGATAAPSRAKLHLAGCFALAGLGCGFLSLKLESVVEQFDTLAFLLSDSDGKLALLREAILLGGVGFALLAGLALLSWRLGVGGFGLALLGMAGSVAPLARSYLQGGKGLEESLIYRIRGLADIGWIGGLFLLFLAILPGLLLAPAGPLEKGLSRIAGGLQEAWIQAAPVIRRAVVFVLALGATLLVGRGVLGNFPNSSDEYSYLTQARIFASGRLWVPAPPHPEYFRARSFVMDAEQGRFFAKAFPGWAALLSVGVLEGMPGLVNPLLSAITLVLLGWLAARLVGERFELPALFLAGMTPFFLFNAASYFNHPLSLLLLTVFLVAVVQLEQGEGEGWAWLAGFMCGASLAVRPASAVLLTSPFLVYLAWNRIRRREWHGLAALFLPMGVFLALIGAYNQALMGSPWLTGYQAYDPGDIRAGFGAANFAVTGWWLLKLLLWTLPGSLAGLYFLLRGPRPVDWLRRQPLMALMFLALLLQVSGHLIFQNKGSNEYGPRYYYDGWVFLTLLAVAGWKRLLEEVGRGERRQRVRRGLVLGSACAAFLTLFLTLPLLFLHYRDKVDHNRDLYTRVEATGLSSALVILQTGSGRMPPGDLVRNPLDFRTGIVYARDLGQEARGQLEGLYPDRPILVYAYDPYLRRSRLARVNGEARP
jgi:hypothetical protein